MSTSQHSAGEHSSSASPHTYVFDPEDLAELTRLQRQSSLVTQGLGGVLPERNNRLPPDCHRVLDLGCGPGEWVQQVASLHPLAQVTGMDISTIMLAYAKAQASAAQVSNAHFIQGTLLETFDLPANTFDLVNERLLGAVLRRERWPGFLQECLRITRPGGWIRVTEPNELWRTNQPAWERMSPWQRTLLHRSGYGFAPAEPVTSLELGPALASLLAEVGWTEVVIQERLMEFPAGSAIHQGMCENARVVAKGFAPMFIRLGITTPEEFQQTYDAMVAETTASDFYGYWRFYTITARKPEHSE